MFSIKVLNADRETKFAESGEKEAYLVVDAAYEEGDSVVLEYSGEPRYFVFQADDAMGEALIYVKGNVEVTVPFGETKLGRSEERRVGKECRL